MSTDRGSRTAPKPDVPEGGTCDWGHCDEEAVDSRWSSEHGWLPVCATHSKELERVVDVIARTVGFDPPQPGLIGSGLSQMMAYDRAAAICRAIGVPMTLDVDVLRAWGKGAVVHLAGVTEEPA